MPMKVSVGPTHDHRNLIWSIAAACSQLSRHIHEKGSRITIGLLIELDQDDADGVVHDSGLMFTRSPGSADRQSLESPQRPD
jgi:hypothetical protein